MDAVTTPDELAFLRGGGELAGLVRTFDWSRTSLGPIEQWPQVVKSTCALILRAPIPMVSLWGEKGVLLYNDAYAEFAGQRHPDILGANVLDAWPEAADWNSLVMDTVFRRGEPLSTQDLELVLHRFGRGETVFLNLDYSPIPDEQGAPVGVIAIVVDTTAKVRAERLLSGERERLTRMFDQAPGFMALLEGPEHVFAMANRAYFNLIGGREAIGKRITEALPEVEGQGFVTLLDEVFAKGEAFVGRAVSVLLNRADGQGEEERFVDFIYQPVTADGEVTGIFVQGHDVTDRQLALRVAEESEARFRLIAERAPVMLWMSHADGSCAYLNKSQRDFWGLAEGDYGSFNWSSTIHPGDADRLFAQWTKAMEAQSGFALDARYKRHDGVYRLFQTHAEPRYGPNGEFLGMIGVNVDITDLRDAEERYRRIFEQASDLILTADLDQVITDTNPAAAEAVGLTRESAIGRRISDFISPEDFERSSEALRSKLSDGGTTQYDVRVRNAAGEWLNWEINSGLTFDDAGNPVGLHVVARDVTERKRLERHQQLLVGELNHRVKNTLAIVQSLTHQSFRSSASPEEAIKRFEGRLEALAAAHNLLTRNSWEKASIKDVAATVLSPFCPDERCDIEGPDVRVSPQTAVSLALALHELATNASKYGALSNAVGRISVRWTVTDGTLRLKWSETGGPPVTPPDKRGFGTRMIERTLAADFGGTVDLDFAPDGVTCTVVAPVPELHS